MQRKRGIKFNFIFFFITYLVSAKPQIFGGCPKYQIYLDVYLILRKYFCKSIPKAYFPDFIQFVLI